MGLKKGIQGVGSGAGAEPAPAPTVAVMWFRFGPYHLARLRGAALGAKAIGARIVGLEMASQDDVYAWESCGGGADGFERVTVFPGRNYHALGPRRIRAGVLEALDRLQPAAVAINGWGVPEARAAIGWCRRSGARAILTSESKEDDGEGRRVWWKEWVKRWLVRRCDAALVGGRRHADYLVKLGFPADRIAFGYDVVDNDYFAGETAGVRQRAAALRRESGLPARFFFVCTRFIPRKNVDGLLRAYAAYRAACQGEPWGLVIAGSGDESERLRGLERELGVAGVVWPGFVQYDRLPVYFGLASAFVHPAQSEPWGLVVNEAAASGLPLLVSQTVGAGYELLRPGENGFRFDPFRVEAMAAALSAMAQATEEERAAMGARSRQIVAEWSPLRFGQGLMTAIEMAGGL